MKYIRKHIKIITTILIIILSITYIFFKLKLNKNSYINLPTYNEYSTLKEEVNTKDIDKEIEEQVTSTKEEKTIIKVDVKGEVKKPNVYELDSNSRVIDAINKAGGLTKYADTSLLNLSKYVKDQMVIIVYSKKEVENMQKDNVVIKEVVKEIEKECDCNDITNDAIIKEDNENKNEEESTLINLNTCTKEQLETVKGLGESKANAIITYQKEKGFTKIEDLLEVKGIGQALYEKIKDYFTIK